MEVDVWRVDLCWVGARLEEALKTLAPEEQERARRFRFPADRRRYLAAHCALRMILARYLRAEPDSLRFSYSEFGKPELALQHGFAPLRFNLSHSHELALVAVASERAVGVDVEYVRRDVRAAEIARRFFSPREAAALQSLEPERQDEGFFACWTRKEAFTKARGQGLSHPLDQFDVDCTPGGLSCLLSTRPDPAEASRWTLLSLPVGPGYAAALAVYGRDPELRCWLWQS
ncbi:MAG: 4'-phosphopantetheinyl transferase superfamily protein [Acidobacteriota bacterium]|nr:4'-phosphopantetheinyl transferase superfamily protein [Acidobacteriota bacterium]